jgi:hypothetical protein
LPAFAFGTRSIPFAAYRFALTAYRLSLCVEKNPKHRPIYIHSKQDQDVDNQLHVINIEFISILNT